MTEHDLVVDTVERFARETLAPRAASLDRGEADARCHLPQMAELGLLGMNLPPDCGGVGVDAQTLVNALQQLAYGCASTASLLTAHYLATDAILLAGDEALKQRFLPNAADGKWLGAYALTEPQAGSNPADMRTVAERDGDAYQVRGVKHFISNAGFADFLVVFAKTDPQAAGRGISAFVLEVADTAGVEFAAPEPTMGMRASPVYEVRLDCRVPAENLVGAEGSGMKTALRVLDNGRVDIAAIAIGIAAASYDASVDWLKQRKVGGQLLAEYQGLQWQLADMATRLEAARALLQRAAIARDSGERFTRIASITKLFATEAAAFITDSALQLHGGYGYTTAMPLERYVRDVRITRIYEGTSEIQRNIIAREELRELR